MTPARWRPALRMARRDLRLHKGRSLLTVMLVAVPVLVAVTISLFVHNTAWQGEQQARREMGAADARIEVTPWSRARVAYTHHGYVDYGPAAFTRNDNDRRRPARRDRATVDLAGLLPEGSRIVADQGWSDARLASGGRVGVTHLDAADPLTVGIVELRAGRAPSAPDEVAVTHAMAEALDMLAPSGELRDDARLEMLSGDALPVVGLLRDGPWTGSEILTARTSVLGAPANPSYLVDLPDLPDPTRRELRDLAATLSAAGVVLTPRDFVLNPRDWARNAPPAAPLDPSALAAGALAILLGLLEVVLVVGSVFAIAARRQVRSLGLLAAAGGAPSDVRRVLFAQGIVLGVVASLLGAAAGIAAFHAGVPAYEAITGARVWTRDVDWLTLAGLTTLGAVTGLAAALVPAFSISRLTPVAALSGRFPIRAGESAAHRPAFVVAGLGLLLLALGGWWTSLEFGPLPPTGYDDAPSPLPVVVAGFGLVLLVAGVVWCAPYAVRRVGALGRVLPLSGRFAFREASRHRFRTGAAAVTLAVTVAAAVLAGFATASATAVQAGYDDTPPRSVGLWDVPADPGSRAHQAMVDTLESTFGAVEVHTTANATVPGRGHDLRVHRGRGIGYLEIVDEETLRYIVGPAEADHAVEAFRAGTVVRSWGREDLALRVSAHPRRQHPQMSRTLPSLRVDAENGDAWELAGSWISRERAEQLGLVAGQGSALVLLERPVERADMTALALAGYDGTTSDLRSEQLRHATWGITGGVGMLALLVSGMAVALAASESRATAATFAAVGAGPRRRRGLGAMHGLFLGVVGTALGLAIAVPAGLALTQVDRLAGVAVPWWTLLGTLLAAPLFAAVAGWLVTPTRLSLVRRTT